jgi:hypothetical protein
MNTCRCARCIGGKINYQIAVQMVKLSKHYMRYHYCSKKYNRLQAHRACFWSAYKAYIKKVNLAELQIEPASVFGDLRDRGSGRKVDL